MKSFFAPLSARVLVGQAIGLVVTATVGLLILYVGIRAQVYEDILASGSAAVEMLESVIKQDPDLKQFNSESHAQQLDKALDQFVAEFAGISRMSVVDHNLRIIADTSNVQVGSVSDQNTLIELMQNPREDVEPLFYTRAGLRYIRISQAIHGLYDPTRDSDVIGAVSIDLSLSEAERQVNIIFGWAAGVLFLLFALQLSLQYLSLRHWVLNPIRELVHAAQKIGRGQFDSRALISPVHELEEMERAFNTMAEEIERTNTMLQENTQSLHTIIQSSPLAMIKMNNEQKVVMWNPAAERIFGWSREEALGHPLQTIPPDKQAETASMFKTLLSGQSLTGFNTQRLRKDGTRIDVSISAAPLYDPLGNVTGFSSIVADITNLKQAEEAMKASNESLSITVAKLEQRTQELTLLSEMGELLQTCHTTEEAHLVIARSIGTIFPKLDGVLYEIPPSRDQMEPIASWGVNPNARPFEMDSCWALRRGRSYLVTNPDSNLICPHISNNLTEPTPYVCVPMMAQGEALGILHLRCAPGSQSLLLDNQKLIETVAEQLALALSNLKLREELRQQSIRDPLTGLYNRRYLDETLAREISRAKRNDLPVGIILMDLDHFKSFNDTFSHKAGDEVLRILGRFLQTQARADDIACRYGGEEFTLILPGTSQDVTQQRAEQLRVGVRALKMNFEGQTLGSLTLSVGVAMFPIHGDDGHDVLQAADAALYRAKQNGRDRVELAE